MKFVFGPSFHWGDRHIGRDPSGRRFRASARTVLPALFLCCAALAPDRAWAEKDDDEHGHDEPKVKVSESRSMRFGTVTSSTDGSGTVVLSPNGVLSATGYATILRDQSRVGKFEIEGPDNAMVIITLPTTATFSNGTSTTTLSNFTSSPSAGVATLNRKGKLTLSVGATMNIPAGQSAGDYTGTFTIYVDVQ